MTVNCVQCVVLWIILSASFGINDAQFCIDHGDNPETPYVKMCTAHSLSIQAGQSIYIDSTFDPKMQKVSCNCTFTLPYTANLQLAYRVRTPLPNECEASFKIDDSTTSWGCVNYSHTFQIPTTGNLSYIKNINTIPDWQSCTKITPMAGASLTVSCFPSRIYYAPEDNVDGVWGQWAAWTQCSVTCAGGTQTRTRQCNNPPRQHNGTLCSTSDGTEMEEESESRTCNDGSCTSPVDGQYSEWTQWNTCTTTCDGGTKTRSRQCNNPAPQNGGSDCTGDASESTTCGTQPCPVDGEYSDWSTWSTCSQTCGEGTQTRSRTCDNPAPQHGGQSCTGNTADTQTCTIRPCPVDGEYSTWGTWSTCSQTCGEGTQTRSRTCDNPAPQHGGQSCAGNNNDNKTCTIRPCPVDGQYSEWSTWGTCSLTCGQGSQTRSRTCTNPAPQHGGQSCTGVSSQTQTCSSQTCPVDGVWSSWSTWTACSITCGNGGYKTRLRECNDPAPDHGGDECVGDMSEPETCDIINCPVNGQWSGWGNWSSCSETCGTGITSRQRYCTNPSPQYGGNYCSGNNSETETCTVSSCAVDGEWGTWSTFSTCSVTCGNGNKNRIRSCNSPPPSNGGRNCEGQSVDTSSCDNHPCPVDGNWGPWSPWSACSATCDKGAMSRTRNCDNPSPSNGGSTCSGSNNQSSLCSTITPCPVKAQWGPWSPWNDCSATCGESTVKRRRVCDNPPPEEDGNNCNGKAEDVQQCSGNGPCPIDGGVGPWSPWSTCSVSCSTGTKSRLRLCNNPSPTNGGRKCINPLNENGDCYTNCTGSEDNTQSSTQGTGTGTGNEQVDAQKQTPAAGASIGGLVGGIIGGLLFVFLVVLLLICFLRRRRKREPEPKTGPRSVRYMSGDDVTVTENELYNYDGENPAHATNALFVGGIPETPTSPGFIPHYSTDTGDRYAVIMDSTRRKQKAKERPSLQSFNSTEKDTATTNGDIRASTDTVKLAENYNEDIPGDGLENPGYDESYLAPYDSPTEHKPKTSSSSSPSPYDYIDHQKLKLDDEEYERENAANDYATLPDERDDAESDYDGRYKRFINKDPIDDASDGYLKSPTRDKTFEYPDLN